MVEHLVSEELQDLLRHGRKFQRSKGQVLQTTTDQKNFNFLTKGYIKRYLISNEGTLGVEVIYGPGDIFPITLAFKGIFKHDINEGPEVFYYEAMTEVTLYAIDIRTLTDTVKQNPRLYRELFLECGKRLHSTLHGLENLTLKNSYKRVAHQIHYLAYRFGEKKLGGIKIAVPLTHQDIADILSLTRETVSMCMVQLRDQKLIVPGRHILVPNPKKLQDEAHG